eukprot:TRINITY_DN8533_c0_g7_i1.p1 TRINITY_DN8533_c0_g7~~TRINITY_DN8533_c0_g7_i1.p1  ORF type:complete len:1224 (-),score=148.02 TRINITY_DN8533_c0_g7_i1:532-4203(-)
MSVRFRDQFQARIAQLKSAPEFKEHVNYVTLKSSCEPVSESPTALPKTTSSKRKSFATRMVSKTSIVSFKVTPSIDMAESILAEARKVHSVVDIVEDRLHDTGNFISALKDKASQDSGFTSDDMQQLLNVQKERDQLAKDLSEYKSLNFRALMKLLKAHHDAEGDDAYGTLLPQVLEHLNPKKHVGRQNLASELDAFFESAAHDLSDAERSCFMESRDMIKNQFLEVLDQTRTTCVSEGPAQLKQTPPWWKRRTLPIFKVLLTEYSWNHFARDIVAAVVISVAGIPKAMSYAALAGLPVAAGIATLYLPSFVYALLGSSRQVAISPQSVTCLLLGQMVSESLSGTEFEGDAAQQVSVAMTLTLYTGCVISLFGALHLSFLLNFISKSVLSGFISASAIIAAVSTLKSLLGLYVKKSPILYTLVARTIAELPHIHWPTALVSFVGISFLSLMPFLQKRIAKRLKNVEHSCARGVHSAMKVPTVLYLMALGILLGSGLCSFQPFALWQVDHMVRGRGATAPSLYFQHVDKRFNCSHHSRKAAAIYQPTSTSDGIRIGAGNASSSVHFTAVDVVPPQDNKSLTLPVLSSFVCAVVNIPFLSDSEQISFVLDIPTVAAIFAGEVQTWSDPRIMQANPNLPWDILDANTSISVVVRKKGSGTTAAFAAGLLNCTRCNASRWVAGLTVDWGAPNLKRAESNADVVEVVANTPWSIGYATYAAVDAAAKSNARCLAWQVGSRIITPAIAWRYPSEIRWPTSLISYVWIPNLDSLDCRSRQWLKSYVESAYDLEDVARVSNYQLMARPAQLQKIACAGYNVRRLAAAEESDPQDFKCSLPSPKCLDIKVVGYIDASMPQPTVPEIGIQLDFSVKLRYALMLAAVALLEHVANVKMYVDREGYTVSMSADIVAVGMANIVGAFFGSFVVAGGFSRSALNERAASQLSLLMSVLVSFVVTVVVAPLLSMLPDAVLNIILFCAVVPLVDFKTFAALLRLGRHGYVDLLSLGAAFMATCFLGVVQGMLLAIMVSLVEFVWKSLFPQISELHRSPGSLHYVSKIEEAQPRLSFQGALFSPTTSLSKIQGQLNKYAQHPPRKKKRIQVLRFEAPLWFANAANLSDMLLDELRESFTQGIILDMSTVPWMDNTAANILKKVLIDAADKGVLVVFANVNEDVCFFLKEVCLVHQSKILKTVYAAEMAVRSNLSTMSPTLSEEQEITREKSDCSTWVEDL